MQKKVIAVLVTTLVIFVWGFLYWGASPMPYSSLNKTADDAAAQVALRQHFPESGAYMVPHQDQSQEEISSLYEAGPAGFVHLQYGRTPEQNMTQTLIMGFMLDLVIVIMLLGFFHVAKAREFRDYAWLSMAAGAVAAISVHVGDMIWWQIAVGWKFWQLFYEFSVWVIAGHLLGYFLKADNQTPEYTAES